jgi:hypothetical protein
VHRLHPVLPNQPGKPLFVLFRWLGTDALNLPIDVEPQISTGLKVF